MDCPRCHSKDINSSGICLSCGYELSHWMKELTQRLQAMRLKEKELEEGIDRNLQGFIDAAVSRQSVASSSSEADRLTSTPATEELVFSETGGTDEPEIDLYVATQDDTQYSVDAVASLFSQEADKPPFTPATEEPVFGKTGDTDEPEIDLFVASQDDSQNAVDAVASLFSPEVDKPPYTPAAEEPVFRETGNTDEPEIDLFVTTQDDTQYAEYSVASLFSPEVDTPHSMPATEEPVFRETGDTDESEMTVTAEDDTLFASEALDAGDDSEDEDSSYIAGAINPEGRLIFLSRTLSGLVDLFLAAFFSGVFLCAADYFTNAPMLSSINAINVTVVFLMIYFLYTIFFLRTNRQTIGMMVTDLRIVSMNENQLLMSQVIRRSATFLVSVFGLGIGLLIGVFDRKCLCLHDRLSETRVVRAL